MYNSMYPQNTCGCSLYPKNVCGCKPMPMPMYHEEKPHCNVIHKYNVKEVPHYCNYHTHIVNHNIKKHVYIPKYTCSNENVCNDIYCGKC